MKVKMYLIVNTESNVKIKENGLLKILVFDRKAMAFTIYNL